HPPSPFDVPYVPEPEYPEYLSPSDAEVPLEDQPLPADASPTTLSPGYVVDSNLDEDPEEDPKEDHADYPADGGDCNDEPFDDDDDDDTDDEDEEPFEDEDDDEKEEEHLALVDSFAIPIIDHVPSAGDTEAFETDESAPTPRSPQTKVPFAQTRLRRAWKTVRLEQPMLASMEARIAEHAAAPTPPLPVATDIPEAEMLSWKRACLTTPALGLEIEESSAAGAARQLGTTLEADLRRDRVMETGYGITNTWDEIVEAMLRKNEESQVRFEDAQDDPRVNTLFRDRPYHRHTAMILDREAMYARIAWTSSEDRSAAIEDHVRILEAHVATFIAQTLSLQTQLTTTLGRIKTLEAIDLEP
ncbi:hypothetical protein Tco_1581091, partial [Tanacetum coccineum]